MEARRNQAPHRLHLLGRLSVGNDIAGKVTMGTSTGSCVVTFAKAYDTNAPVCVVSQAFSSATSNAYHGLTTTTTLTITSDINMDSAVVAYICLGRE